MFGLIKAELAKLEINAFVTFITYTFNGLMRALSEFFILEDIIILMFQWSHY